MILLIKCVTVYVTLCLFTLRYTESIFLIFINMKSLQMHQNIFRETPVSLRNTIFNEPPTQGSFVLTQRRSLTFKCHYRWALVVYSSPASNPKIGSFDRAYLRFHGCVSRAFRLYLDKSKSTIISR